MNGYGSKACFLPRCSATYALSAIQRTTKMRLHCQVAAGAEKTRDRLSPAGERVGVIAGAATGTAWG